MFDLYKSKDGVKSSDWKVDFNKSIGHFFFEHKDFSLLSEPIELGALNEGIGLLKKNRFHKLKYDNSLTLESEILLPFGSEPAVCKTIDFINNYAKITTDLQLKGAFPMNKISFGKVVLKAKWTKYAIVDLYSQKIETLSWNKINDVSELYSSSIPFRVMLLETEDGTRLEIGTGDDIWRWLGAKDKNANSLFSVTKEGDTITINRDTYLWDEETTFSSQNIRFNWYFSWVLKDDLSENIYQNKEIKSLPTAKDKSSWNNFSNYIWRLDTIENENWLSSINGESSDDICMSSSVIKRLKKVIRSIKSNANEDIFCLVGITPQLCDNPSHLERKQKKQLLHWNINKILDFYLWATKQLLDKNSQLVIISEKESVYNQFPSICSMRKDRTKSKTIELSK